MLALLLTFFFISGEIWSTDLDLFVPNEDRITVLATLKPLPHQTTTSMPLMNPVVSPGALDHLAALALATQSTNSLRSASMLRNLQDSGPTLDYLRDRSYKGDRKDSAPDTVQLPNIGKLPVGSTIPLANLGVNIPSTRSNHNDESFRKESQLNRLSTASQKGITKVIPVFDDVGKDAHRHIVSHDHQPVPLGRGLVWKPVSPEFLNFSLALLLYAIR